VFTPCRIPLRRHRFRCVRTTAASILSAQATSHLSRKTHIPVARHLVTLITPSNFSTAPPDHTGYGTQEDYWPLHVSLIGSCRSVLHYHTAVFSRVSGVRRAASMPNPLRHAIHFPILSSFHAPASGAHGGKGKPMLLEDDPSLCRPLRDNVDVSLAEEGLPCIVCLRIIDVLIWTVDSQVVESMGSSPSPWSS